MYTVTGIAFGTIISSIVRFDYIRYLNSDTFDDICSSYDVTFAVWINHNSSKVAVVVVVKHCENAMGKCKELEGDFSPLSVN